MNKDIMTYKELQTAINELNEEQLNMDVTVYVRGVDEYYPAQSFGSTPAPADEADILDPNHPYLLI